MFHSCFCDVLIIMHQLLQENDNLHKCDTLDIVNRIIHIFFFKVLIQLITKQVFQIEDIQL